MYGFVVVVLIFVLGIIAAKVDVVLFENMIDVIFDAVFVIASVLVVLGSVDVLDVVVEVVGVKAFVTDLLVLGIGIIVVMGYVPCVIVGFVFVMVG